MKRPLLAALMLVLSVVCPGRVMAGFGGLNDEEIVSASQARQDQRDRPRLVFLDARGLRSYEQSHLEGALLPLTRDFYREEELFRQGVIPKLSDRKAALAQATKSIPKDRPLITYCSEKCNASAVLLYELKRLGFSDVRALDGGIQAWQAAGYPVASGPAATVESLA